MIITQREFLRRFSRPTCLQVEAHVVGYRPRKVRRWVAPLVVGLIVLAVCQGFDLWRTWRRTHPGNMFTIKPETAPGLVPQEPGSWI